MSRERLEQGVSNVEGELAQERAAALGRSGRRLEDEHRRCHDLLDRLVHQPHDHALLAQYRLARAAFEEALWKYCVHREAIGLWDHTWVHRICPTPPRR